MKEELPNYSVEEAELTINDFLNMFSLYIDTLDEEILDIEEIFIY